jgi:hypothetical protein
VALPAIFNLRFTPHGKAKSLLDNLFHPAKIQLVLSPQRKTLGIYPSGGLYEKRLQKLAIIPKERRKLW